MKAQNWFAVGLDFVIVVVGVFVGLQVQDWNDSRKERVEESLNSDILPLQVLPMRRPRKILPLT